MPTYINNISRQKYVQGHFRNHLNSALISNPSPLDFFWKWNSSQKLKWQQFHHNTIQLKNIRYINLILNVLKCDQKSTVMFQQQQSNWCVQWAHIKYLCCAGWCTRSVKCSCSVFRATRKLCPVTQACAAIITVDWQCIWFCSDFCSLHTRNCMQIYVHMYEGWRLIPGRHLPQFSTWPFKI